MAVLELAAYGASTSAGSIDSTILIMALQARGASSSAGYASCIILVPVRTTQVLALADVAGETVRATEILLAAEAIPKPPERVSQVTLAAEAIPEPPERITQVTLAADVSGEPPLRVTQVVLMVDCRLRRQPLTTDLLEFHVYDRANAYLDYLDQAFEMAVLAQLSDCGSGKFKIPAGDDRATAANLAYGNIVHVRYRNVDVGAFVIEPLKEPLVSEQGKTGEITEVAGRGMLALLERGIVYPADLGDPDSSRRAFGSATCGDIMLTLYNEFQARGGGDLVPDFTATHDSGGNAWEDAQTEEYSAGQSLLEVARHHAALGIEITTDADGGLHYWKSCGTDRSATIIFREGLNILRAERLKDGTELRNVVLGEAQDALAETTDPASISGHGRAETYLRAGNTDDTAQLEAASEELLDKVAEPVETLSLVVTTTPHPFIDYGLGDTVRVIIPSRSLDATYRVMSIGLIEGQNPRDLRATLELNAVHVGYATRLHRALEASRAVGPTAAAGYSLASADTRPASRSGHTHIRDGVLGFTFNGGGEALTTGLKGYAPIPANGTIQSWELVGDQAGDLTIDIWCDSYANFPPTAADSICGTALPSLSGAQKAQGTSLSGWTTTLTKGNWLAFNVDAAGTVEVAVLSLYVRWGLP